MQDNRNDPFTDPDAYYEAQFGDQERDDDRQIAAGKIWDEDKEEWVYPPSPAPAPTSPTLPACLYDPFLSEDEFERELDNLSDDDKDLIRAISDSVIAAHDYTGLTDVTIKLTEKAMAKGKVIA